MTTNVAAIHDTQGAPSGSLYEQLLELCSRLAEAARL